MKVRIADPEIREWLDEVQPESTPRRDVRLRGTVPMPSIQTDTTFLEGGDGFDSDEDRLAAHKAARAAGVTPSGRYISQLAEFPHDPRAWVNSTAEVKRRCEQSGFSCDGAVKVKASPISGPGHLEEPYQVADDIVQEGVAKQLGDNVVSAQERGDLEDKLRKRYSGAE